MARKSVSNWLFGCAFMVFVMVVIGGLTRLTNSGLSMVNWHPITGILPPMTQDAWQQVFELYKQSPEYLKINYDMDLAGFKSIFWLEYIHRVWGRLIGFVFFVPLVIFFVRKKINGRELGKFLLIFLLGAAQGFMGWYMVKSGLIDVPHVSPYRLTVHLLLAFWLFSLLMWQALSYRNPQHVRRGALPHLLISMVIGTIVYGGLVAGHKAGYLYNTFPLMGEQWVPEELFFTSPWYANLVGNPVTVQFIHRVLAILTFVYVHYCLIKHMRAGTVQNGIGLTVIALTWVQLVLGIATLVSGVDIALATAHQGNALLLLGGCILFAFFRKSRDAGKLPTFNPL